MYYLVKNIENEIKEAFDYEGNVSFSFGKFADLSILNAKKISKETEIELEIVLNKIKEICENHNLEAKIEKIFVNCSIPNYILEEIVENNMKLPNIDKRIVIDYSSPNIAKPFSVGHLRSTIIGDSLRRIFEFRNAKVYGVNFVGDWGKQFGKLLAAYSLWKDEVDLSKNPIRALFDLYVKFHKEAEKNPELEKLADLWFQKLENKDKEAIELWEKFKSLSMNEFNRIYSLLDIKPLIYYGESLFVEDAKRLVNDLLEKGIAKESEGAIIVEFEDLPPLILRKKDGTTIYGARDIAAALRRAEEFNSRNLLYVVGNEQKLHFNQIFRVVKMLNPDLELEHISFGLVRLPEGKMSTRKGRVIFLEDVLNEAINRVKEKLKEKDIDDEETARIIGIGAVKFADLKNNRIRDIVFSWDILDFNGETGPYVQYACVRSKRIIEKEGEGEIGIDKEFRPLALKLALASIYLDEATEKRRPDILANYALDLVNTYNKLYEKYKISGNKHRLWINAKFNKTLTKILDLLGIKVPAYM